MTRPSPWHVLWLSLFVLAPRLAGAQATGCADGAQDLFERGMRTLEAGRSHDAIPLLEASYFCRAVPGTLYNLAAAYDGVGSYLRAVESYQRYLQDQRAGNADERTLRVRSRIEVLQGHLGLIVLRRLPEGAQVFVDGRERPLFVGGLYVNPGVNVLDVRAAGHQSVRRDLRVVAGGRVEIEMTMEPVGATAQQAPDGEVTFDVSPPNAEITVDGHLLGQGNLQRRVAEGRHVIEVRARGYIPELRPVSIERGVVQQYAITLVPEARPDDGGVTRRWWFWTIVGGGVLAGGAVATLWFTRPEPVVTVERPLQMDGVTTVRWQ